MGGRNWLSVVFYFLRSFASSPPPSQRNCVCFRCIFVGLLRPDSWRFPANGNCRGKVSRGYFFLLFVTLKQLLVWASFPGSFGAEKPRTATGARGGAAHEAASSDSSFHWPAFAWKEGGRGDLRSTSFRSRVFFQMKIKEWLKIYSSKSDKHKSLSQNMTNELILTEKNQMKVIFTTAASSKKPNSFRQSIFAQVTMQLSLRKRLTRKRRKRKKRNSWNAGR